MVLYHQSLSKRVVSKVWDGVCISIFFSFSRDKIKFKIETIHNTFVFHFSFENASRKNSRNEQNDKEIQFN